MLLVIDNGSVYTPQLTGLLEGEGVAFDISAPQGLRQGSLPEYDSVMLSGRRRNDKKTNEVNSKAVLHCIKNNTKLLGICYGAEILALTLGGTIRRVPKPVTGTETVRTLAKNPLCSGPLDVFESHGFEISALPRPLVPLAESDSCRYEVIRYAGKPIFGTQFHPEMSPDGNALIGNFCSL